MNDDFNTAKLLGYLADGVKQINNLMEGKDQISPSDLSKLKTCYHGFVYSVLGLEKADNETSKDEILKNLIKGYLDMRSKFKSAGNYEKADEIRQLLLEMGITVKDRKNGADWEIN